MPLFRFSPAALSLGAALLLSPSLPTQAQNSAPIVVTVNGTPVNFGDTSPVQVGGRTLVPLRAIFEALGAQVEFSSGTIRARRGDTNLQLALGSSQAVINGAVRTLDVPAQAVFGRTLVPLRFVGEALGANVNFNSATQTISIVSAGGATGSTGSGEGTPAYTVPDTGPSVSGTLVDAPQGTTITISVNGALRTYVLNPNALVLRQISLATSASATPVRQAARRTTLSTLVPGDLLRLNLDAANRVSQITSSATVVVARVQFAGDNQIVLDDERDTTLSIGPAIRFVDANGRVSNNVNGLAVGQNIALFLSRENRAVYQVSAYAPDFTPSISGAADPFNPTNSLPTAGNGQIQLVSHNAATPLRAGTRLEVTVRATSGMRLGFSLGPRIQNVPLTEDPDRPGVYLGSHLVRGGDDVLSARVAVRGTGAGGQEDFAQSTETATLIPSRRVWWDFSGQQRANRRRAAQHCPFSPMIWGQRTGRRANRPPDRRHLNPVVTRLPATVSPTSVNAVATAPLAGNVGVRAVVTDKAGNPLRVNFSFTAIPGMGGTVGEGGAVTRRHYELFARANRAMNPGDDVPLVLLAQPAGRASFDVLMPMARPSRAVSRSSKCAQDVIAPLIAFLIPPRAMCVSSADSSEPTALPHNSKPPRVPKSWGTRTLPPPRFRFKPRAKATA
jgi:hypothetical protein